jgi:hypothetical protein
VPNTLRSRALLLLVVGSATSSVACTGPNPAYQTRNPSDAPVEAGVKTDVPGIVDAPPSGADGPAADVLPPPVDVPVTPIDAPVTIDAPVAPIDVASPDLPGPDVSVSSAGLVLHWRFDEATGSQAFDSSPSALHGADEGGTPPAHDPVIPTTRFPNTHSRRFQVNLNHGVRLASATAVLRPTTGLTVSVWFRTTQTTRSDPVCYGADYFIRFMPPEVEFARRRPAGGSINYVTATGNAPSAFDGQWHHAAGVATPTSTAMFIDGRMVARDGSSVPFTYLSGSFSAGRNAAASLNFEGWLDDVRVYARALTVQEVAALAAGAP